MKNYKNVTNNYLIIVEGEELELNLFEEVFKTIYHDCRISKFVNGVKVESESEDILSSDSKEHFVIVKPKHNALSQILKDVNGDPDSIVPYQYFVNDDIIEYDFKYVFYVFDVDYTTKGELLDAFALFNDATDRGLLLVSAPSIEALADLVSNSFELEKKTGNRISSVYKPLVQRQVQRIVNSSTSSFIRENIFTLFRHCLYKNRTVLGIDDLFMCFYSFQVLDEFTPYYRDGVFHYPIVTSFLYIIIAVLFKFDARPNPFECLDSFLKRYASHDEYNSKIIELSPFLND